MTDKELLELAAKAAGYALRDDVFQDGDWIFIGAGEGDLEPWNPLTDDGDALRLAVKLCLMDEHSVMMGQFDGEDPYAAQRRAIVRAAAEIGKTL